MRLSWDENDPEGLQPLIVRIRKSCRFRTFRKDNIYISQIKTQVLKNYEAMRFSDIPTALAGDLVNLYDQKYQEVIEECSKYS